MAEVITLTDSELNTVLDNGKPALLLFSRGDDLRSEFSIAYKKAAAEHRDIVFAKIDPDANPQAVERFGIGSKAVMIAYFKGEELTRRSRPWGTDVPLAVEMIKKAVSDSQPQESPQEPTTKTPESTQKEKPKVDTKPVIVTDETFQKEVIDYELPVLVDFWAEWCGPCRMVAPTLEKLAKEYAGKIRIAKVDTDANPGLSQYFKVMSIPTIMLFKERNVVFSQPGALPEAAFRDLIEQLIALEIPKQDEKEAVAEPGD